MGAQIQLDMSIAIQSEDEISIFIASPPEILNPVIGLI